MGATLDDLPPGGAWLPPTRPMRPPAEPTQTETFAPHRPHRGSDVEAWIKAWRDGFPKHTTAWYALDDALDDYRLRADVGARLSDPTPNETPEPR